MIDMAAETERHKKYIHPVRQHPLLQRLSDLPQCRIARLNGSLMDLIGSAAQTQGCILQPKIHKLCFVHPPQKRLILSRSYRRHIRRSIVGMHSIRIGEGSIGAPWKAVNERQSMPRLRPADEGQPERETRITTMRRDNTDFQPLTPDFMAS